MIIRASFVIASASIAVSAVTVQPAAVASVRPTSYLEEAVVTQPRRILFTQRLIPLVPLSAADNYVVSTDTDTKLIGPAYTDAVTATEAVALAVDQVLTDSVTVTEAQVKVITNPVDFDPSDDDVDPDPITMADSDAKTLSRPNITDSATMADSDVKEVGKSLTTSTSTPTDAIDKFDVAKALTDSVTVTEVITRFDATTAFTDAVTATEADAKSVTPGTIADAASMSDTPNKIVNSSVDFDPSDDDVDPDPITATDAINTFGLGKALTDTATASDSDAKSLTRPNVTDAATMADSDAKSVSKPFSDTLTAVEGIKLNPALGKTDTATATDTITKFDPRLGKTDSATATDAVNTFAQNKALADTVSITDVAVKNFTENVDYDRNDADADADPVTVADSPAWVTGKALTDSVSGADAIVFSGAKVFTDAVTASESIYTILTLGESSYLYPSRVYMSDGSSKFVQDWFRFRKLDYTAQLNGGDSLLNSAVIWGDSAEDSARAPFTGVMGSDGLIGQVVVNSDTITYPDTSNAGLVVNFLYTEVDDTTVGGYYFNQTPISAGSIEGGDRIIL